MSETTAIKQRKKKKKKKAFLHKINKKKIVFFELDAGNIAFFFFGVTTAEMLAIERMTLFGTPTVQILLFETCIYLWVYPKNIVSQVKASCSMADHRTELQ